MPGVVTPVLYFGTMKTPNDFSLELVRIPYSRGRVKHSVPTDRTVGFHSIACFGWSKPEVRPVIGRSRRKNNSNADKSQPRSQQFGSAIAGQQMIVHHSHGLHECIADCCADK